MTVTISRLYDNYTDAQKALKALASCIPILASSPTTQTIGTAAERKYRNHDGVNDRAEGARKGAGAGLTARFGGSFSLNGGPTLELDKEFWIKEHVRIVGRIKCLS